MADRGNTSVIACILAIYLACLIAAAPAAAQTYDFESSAANWDSPGWRFEAHPAVVWPGETLVLRLAWVVPPAEHGPSDEMPRIWSDLEFEQAERRRQATRIDVLHLLVTDEMGTLVHQGEHHLPDGGSIAEVGRGLVEWSWLWDPTHLQSGFYRAEVRATGPQQSSLHTATEFRLGPLPPLSSEDAGPHSSSDLVASSGLLASDTLAIPPLLVCGLTVRPLRVNPGETVQIRLTVRNDDRETARRYFPDHRPLGFAILDHLDQIVATSAQTPEGEPLDWLELAPGATIERVWSWTWEEAPPSLPPPNHRVTPDRPLSGRYYVRAGLGATGERESAPWTDIVLWPAPMHAFRID